MRGYLAGNSKISSHSIAMSDVIASVTFLAVGSLLQPIGSELDAGYLFGFHCGESAQAREASGLLGKSSPA